MLMHCLKTLSSINNDILFTLYVLNSNDKAAKILYDKRSLLSMPLKRHMWVPVYVLRCNTFSQHILPHSSPHNAPWFSPQIVALYNSLTYFLTYLFTYLLTWCRQINPAHLLHTASVFCKKVNNVTVRIYRPTWCNWPTIWLFAYVRSRSTVLFRQPPLLHVMLDSKYKSPVHPAHHRSCTQTRWYTRHLHRVQHSRDWSQPSQSGLQSAPTYPQPYFTYGRQPGYEIKFCSYNGF